MYVYKYCLGQRAGSLGILGSICQDPGALVADLVEYHSILKRPGYESKSIKKELRPDSFADNMAAPPRAFHLAGSSATRPTANSSFNQASINSGNPRGLSGLRQTTDPGEIGRGSTTAGQEEEDIQVDSTGRRWRQGWPLSKYQNVQVLLVQWEDEDLGVHEEVGKLEAVFSANYPKGYNFYTQRYSIPNDSSEDELARRLLDFRRGATDNDLMILYYAGHAGGSAQKCIWSGKHHHDSPWLNWHSIQNLLLGYPADVLLILDCCFATLAARNHGVGDNWMLGASNKETKATGVARNSFTSTLTRELERCADRYWSKLETLSVQSLDHALVVWERDLDFTPKLTRLTDHECLATDLTPLLHPCQRPRMQPTRTEPIHQPRLQDSNPPLASRPKTSSATTSKGLQAARNHKEHWSSASPFSEPVGKAKIESKDLRILYLPASTDNLDIIRWFETRSIERSSIQKIGPKILSGSTFLGTVITFAGVDIAEQAMRIVDLEFLPRTGQLGHHLAGHQIAIDDKFEGLTCIYSSTKGPSREPTADVVLVHGAYGHPISSFAMDVGDPLNEASWALDCLPKELEDAGIFPRVMTYGWNASAWYDPQCEIESAHEILAKALKHIRTKVPTRPLVFIGQGVGGFLIKKLVIDTINFGFSERNFQNPIQACLFLALPEPFEYSNLTEILPESHVALRPRPYNYLAARNKDVSNISEEFETIRKGWSIRCAFVTEDSLSLVSKVLRKTLTKEPIQPFKPRPANAERVFAKLKSYDTRFLVDDSDSMEGPGWTTTKEVMAHIASIAVKYDKNGVDVRFFNAYLEDEERLNLDTAEKVMRLFDNLDPEGPTPTADTLEVELNEYIHEYKKNRSIKGLNLIVITDGEPSPRQDVEGVIVKYAKMLAQLDAPPLQVGVQFVQVGDEKKAKAFLDSLDNDLQGKHNLDRDVRWLIYLQDGNANNCARWWTPYRGLMVMRIDCTKRSCWEEYSNGWITMRIRKVMRHEDFVSSMNDSIL